MKRSALAFSCILLAAAVVAAPAQVVPSADASRFSITVGAMGSIFQPDFAGQWKYSAPVGFYYPVAKSADQPLFGPGAYVDIKFRRWVQLEGEARWLRFNRFQDIHQDNYLIGPKVPVYHFWKATVYGKALGGFSRMDLGYGHGNFTTIAFGGGLDVKLTKRISIRAFDGEYQYWPSWGNSKLTPYGASAGIGYRVF
jgi:opacity protein-like surface antigen